MRRFSGKGFKLLNIKPRNWVYLAAARATGEGEQCQGQGTMPGMGDSRATNTTSGVVRWCPRSEITFLAVNLSRFARPTPTTILTYEGLQNLINRPCLQSKSKSDYWVVMQQYSVRCLHQIKMNHAYNIELTGRCEIVSWELADTSSCTTNTRDRKCVWWGVSPMLTISHFSVNE